MKSFHLWGLLLLSLPALADTASLQVRLFTSDGCTDFVNGTAENPTLWRQCCVLHDLAYWAGGDKVALKQTDLDLRTCVAATGETAIAEIMYLGVRLGHLAPQGTRGEQWGNAWSETVRRTTLLSVDEINVLEAEILKPEYESLLDISERSAFIVNLRQTN
jgi:hypothetical protein